MATPLKKKTCGMCGCDITGLGRKKYCANCAEVYHKSMMADYMKAYREREKKKKAMQEIATKGESLDDKIAKASELGISYGQLQKQKFMAQIERVKI